MKRFWIALGAVMVFSFGVLGWIGSRIYQEMPPIPDRVVTADGAVVVPEGAIGRGQNVWQSMGGMQVGSVWGHGSYLAPDWTADWLHGEATFMLDEWAKADFSGKAYAELAFEDQARLRGRLEKAMRTNTWDPATRVIILSAYGDAAAIGQAIAAGASGFIIKRSDVDELVLALQLVTSGNTYFSQELAEQMDLTEIAFAARTQADSHSGLTDREREVLQLIAEGHTMKEIADILVISPKTVEGHNSHIMAKIGARNRADLVRYAMGVGLVHPDTPPGSA